MLILFELICLRYLKIYLQKLQIIIIKIVFLNKKQENKKH